MQHNGLNYFAIIALALLHCPCFASGYVWSSDPMLMYFDKEMDLMIDTTACQMTWSTNQYQGTHEARSYHLFIGTSPIQEIKGSNQVCKIEFSSSIFIGKKVRVQISGQQALSLVSTHGSIEINSPLNISGQADSLAGPDTTRIGGYFKTMDDGVDAGPANFSNCSSADLYGRDFETLLGGSVCLSSNTNSQISVVGGGGLELKAQEGAIVIATTISADGYSSDTSKAGAMGGTVRIDAKKVILQRTALVKARGSEAGGGVIQIKSRFDVEGICDSKFDVTGKTAGFVNVLVSTKDTFQVQYIQQGILEIDTTNARWMHRISTNSSMAYSYFGEIEEIPQEGYIGYNVSKFEFQTPILITGSAVVELFGSHSLSVSSKEGIFIGVNIEVGLKKKREDMYKNLGGFCVTDSRASEGAGPGRGRPGANAGAGHGGKGGLLFENDLRHIFGYTYGIYPDIDLIGGSTGTSNCTSNNCTTNETGQIIACGGGAIKIFSEKNLTINAAIQANGRTIHVFGPSSGGSSGGTIILESMKHVILGDNARLEARGADAVESSSNLNPIRGGGGGGVIAIFYKEGLVGNRPDPFENTTGGAGTTPGGNGLVVLNGTRKYGFPEPAVIEDEANYAGCLNISYSLPDPVEVADLKAHEAAPSRCMSECRKKQYHWAFISDKKCICSNDNSTVHKVDEHNCSLRCWSNSSLICGGKPGIYSAYRTGHCVYFTCWHIMTNKTKAIS